MINYPLVKEVFPISSGIFYHSGYNFQSVTKEHLDVLFYCNYSERQVSPLVANIITSIPANENDLKKLGELLRYKYMIKWSKFYQLYVTNYDPIHNYSDEMIETVTDKTVISERTVYLHETDGKVTESISSTKNDDRSHSENVFGSENGSNINNSSIYTFNSSGSVPSNVSDDADSRSYESELTNSDKASETNESSKTIIDDSSKNVTTDNNTRDDFERSRKVTHKGNIGNITTQQMIKQELELRENWNYIDTILQDAKDFLTLSIYL